MQIRTFVGASAAAVLLTGAFLHPQAFAAPFVPATAGRAEAPSLGPGPGGMDCEECLEQNFERYLDALLARKPAKYKKLFQGDPGPEGPRGETGPGLRNIRKVLGPGTSVAPGTEGTDVASCGPDEVMLSGGFNYRGESFEPGEQTISASSMVGDEWHVTLVNQGTKPLEVVAFAVCAQVG
ncbi:hypothetical protein [Streptomyces indicus]|uniref:Secreted protein n=1 Tax=Streptomyces indicus TaxID=417292 RepID=A0A1G9EUL1_9ACTN|nr:hypothetical protein [Streptomyces indicus]SDK79804.1 hypothetical protein SAMN05421806_11269 [Streptomyces indicus]